ncbi:MAG: tripartite tricarboxylate transporter substrate binding protein [Betaproteobacteria bacterium]|nr:tripartite tricarboxylate transporter substrate binding protein [Betaproteobacteria bacterium]
MKSAVRTGRRRMLGGLLAAGAAVAASPVAAQSTAQAQVQNFPAKPIQIIVGFAAGTTTDTIARVAAEHLRARLGQPVVVINKPGANGVIGATEVARAAPDGYTLLATNTSSMTVNPHLYRKLGYVMADFVPVTMMTSAPLILTLNPANERTGQIRTVAELVSWARARPGALSYAAAGPGNITGLTFRILNNHAGIKANEVLYKSAVASQMGVLAKEVDAFIDTPLAVPPIKAGKLTALAVTGPRRWRDLPDVPTMKEAGFPQIDVTFWLALFAPAQTPPAIVEKLHATLATLKDDANLVRQLLPHGDVDLVGPKEFGERLRTESAAWAEIIRRENIQLD